MPLPCLGRTEEESMCMSGEKKEEEEKEEKEEKKNQTMSGVFCPETSKLHCKF